MSKLHENGRFILRTLNDASFEAYFVGGYVRDYLLGNPGNDIDITTNAHPDDIAELFEKVIPTGRAFGTMTVLIEKIPYEVTTYRKETVYDNHRHPKEIRFADSLVEDLRRRDFTINQLTMDKDGKVEDHFEGLQDLEKKLVRTINDPNDRFYEDALRMLRAFRFVAKLGFDIEANTAVGIKRNKDLIRKISIERVQDELFKLLDARNNQRGLKAMVETAFAGALYDMESPIRTLAKTPVPFSRDEALALMFLGKDLDEGPWKLSNVQKKHFKAIGDLHRETKFQGFSPFHLYTYGKKTCLRANTLNRIAGDKDRSEAITHLDETLAVRSLKELALSGSEIRKTLPIRHPSQISRLLSTLLDDVLEGRIKNNHHDLKEAALHYLKTNESEQ
ncbi:MAG: CCA tRNA nucleotidyltransferase [Candidatus Izemoplasmataceae bacterium]